MDDREESEGEMETGRTRREGEETTAWAGASCETATDRWTGEETDVRVPESVADADPSLLQASPQPVLVPPAHPCPRTHRAPSQIPLSTSSSLSSSPPALSTDTSPDAALNREQHQACDSGRPSNVTSTSTAADTSHPSHIHPTDSPVLATTTITATSSSDTLAFNTPASNSTPAPSYTAMSASSSAHTLDTLDALDAAEDAEGRSFNPMQTYGPLLQCAACDPPALYVAPITLHCGHTVCARHVRTDPSDVLPPPPSPTPSSPSALGRLLPAAIRARRSASTAGASASATGSADPSSIPVVPTCPIPLCRQLPRPSIPQINIPPDSTVAYYPPINNTPTGTEPPAKITIANPRVDVSVGRVLALLDRAETESLNVAAGEDEERGTRAPDTDDENTEEEGEEDTDQNVAPSSSTLPSSSSAAGPSQQRRPHRSNHDRPRKRLRRDEATDSRFPPNRHNDEHGVRRRPWCPTQDDRAERFSKELVESLTCEICFMLLYQPVTTPCQHTFCAKCLHRSLDHGSRCPLCRQNLPPFSYFQDHPYNKVILAILMTACPETYEERRLTIEAEERDARLDTPIFVCQLSFPHMPTLLHFFEPRYRLMLRRCLESRNPCFGMIMPPRVVGSPGNDYGTMLEIRSVQMLPDGRSVVETWGTHRFRILERGTLDGYMVGRIERIDDVPVELEDEGDGHIASAIAARLLPGATPSTKPTNEELVAICQAFVEQLRNGTAPWVVQRLHNTYGPMPTDHYSFSFWMALVLPIDEHEKAKLLPIKSARLRLQLVVYWIEQLNSNWWFSDGCSIS